MFGIPESELAKTLREIGRETDLRALEITTCLRAGELEVEIRYRPGAEEARERLVEGLVAAPWPLHLQPGRLFDRRADRGAAAAATRSRWPSRARRASWPRG